MVRIRRNIALHMVAAALLGSAAVTPAVAGERVARTLAEWRADVNRQIDARLSMPAGGLRHGDHAIATVLVGLDAAGQLASVDLAQPTGDAGVDEQALRTARAVNYPRLPAGLRGRPRTIAMMLYFGEPGSDSAAARQVGEAAALAAAADRRSDRSLTAQACATKLPKS